MLILQIFYALSVLPDLQNHRYLAMFVNIGLLLGARDGVFFNPKTTWIIARTVLIVYFFATFHKLNHDFFDTTVSCGSQFLDHVKFLHSFPDISSTFIIYCTVVVEAVLTFLLVSPRTWKMAALVGIIFHLGLSFDYFKMFINFTAIMAGLLSMIANPLPIDNIILNKRNYKILLLFLITAFMLTGFNFISTDLYIFIVHSLLIVWCFGLILFLLSSGSSFSFSNSGLEIILVCVVFLNGAAPYIGLKNRGSFNMYSNLQISSKYSNHLLISKGGDVLGFNGIQPNGILGKLFPFHPAGPEERDKCVW